MSSAVQATSSTASSDQLDVGTSNIQLITDALADYAKVSRIDLSKNPFAATIERANSPGVILELLQEREKAFKDNREGHRRLISCLGPTVNVIQAFSGTLGEVATLVSHTRYLVTLLTDLLRSPSHQERLCSLGSMSYSLKSPFSAPLKQHSFDIWVCQAASGVMSSYNALLDFFECLGNFLQRLEVYTTIPPTLMMDLIIKILVELLSVLAYTV